MYTGHRLDFQSSKPATRAGFYVSEGRIMGQRLIRISRGMASGFPAAGGFSPPFAPQNLTLTNQGGAVNTNTSTQQIAWDVAVAGTFPVSSYNVYRNGSFLANTAALSYSDTTATNSIQENTFAPSTPYVYSVSAVDTHSNEYLPRRRCTHKASTARKCFPECYLSPSCRYRTARRCWREMSHYDKRCTS